MKRNLALKMKLILSGLFLLFPTVVMAETPFYLRPIGEKEKHSVATCYYNIQESDVVTPEQYVNMGYLDTGVQNEVTCLIVNSSSRTFNVFSHFAFGNYYNNNLPLSWAEGVDGCSGELAPGGSCSVTILFNPQGRHSSAWGEYWGYHIETGRYVKIRFEFSGGGKETPVEPPKKCKKKDPGSIINTDALSFGESIPIVGSEVSVVYSSEFAEEYNTTYENIHKESSFNPEGWSFSLVHYYNSAQKRLFLGTGESTTAENRVMPSGELMVVNGDDVFIFDTSGKHLRTLGSLTGYTKYTFEYDGTGYLSSITDAYGNETLILRDSYGDLAAIEAPYGQRTDFLVQNGLINRITRPDGTYYTATYKSGTELLQKFVDPDGRYSEAFYDDFGKLVRNSHAVNDSLEFIRTFNAGTVTTKKRLNYYKQWISEAGRNTSGAFQRRDFSPQGDQTVYFENSNEDSVASDVSGVVTTTTSDDPRFGSLKKYVSKRERTIGSVSSSLQYTKSVADLNPLDPFEFSRLAEQTTDGGNISSSLFTKSNGTVFSLSAAGVSNTQVLDAFERLVSIQVGNDNPTLYGYDTHGRIISASRDQFHQSVAYNDQGFIDRISNSRNEEISFLYDDLGRKIKETQMGIQETFYHYDSAGNIVAITTPRGFIHNFDFNVFDQMSLYKSPMAKTGNIYSYDSYRDLTGIRRADGQVVTIQYDQTTRNMSEMNISPTQKIQYFYEPNSSRLSGLKSQDDLTSLYEYYGNQLEKIKLLDGSQEIGRISYGFDSNHRVTSQIVIDGDGESVNTNYEYNRDGLVSKAGPLVIAYEYPSGRIGSMKIGSISEYRKYDANGNINRIRVVNDMDHSELYAVQYQRDGSGRIVGQNTSIGERRESLTYVYDSFQRLRSVGQNGVTTSSYTYDSNGNMTAGIQNGMPFVATYDADDRLMQFNGMAYRYTGNGELSYSETSLGSGMLLRWNSMGDLDRLTTEQGDQIEYKYDGQRNRAIKYLNGNKESQYLFDGKKLIATFDALGKLKITYVFATGSHSPDYFVRDGKFYKIVKDHLGSVRLVIRVVDGKVVQKIDYSDQGIVVSDTNPGFQDYGFAGGIYDSKTKFVRFGGRDYDPKSGRWTSRDPVLFAGGDINLYRYVLSDPINLIDPAGTDWIDVAQDANDFAAGASNSLSLGLSDALMGATGNSVNKCSGAYQAGQATALVASIARLAYAGAAKGVALASSSGASASAARNTLKAIFRGGRWGPGYVSFEQMLARYGSSDAVRRAAGRTNPGFNAWAGGAAVSSTNQCGCP